MPKLAEALVERKGLQERFERLCQRLEANAKTQEGDQPDEQPAALMDEGQTILDSIQRLSIQINRTNIAAALPGRSDGTTLMQAIAERDRLQSERRMLERLVHQARINQPQGYGVTRNEIKWRPTVSIADIQKQIDVLSQSYRLLDTQIQQANWLIDLLQN